MTVLTVTAKGQVILRKNFLKHLGVQPGEKVAVDKLPDGRIEVKAGRPGGKIADVFNVLKREDARSLSIEEMEPGRRRCLGRQTVKITADTNVLVRALAGDDVVQSKIAQDELANADMVALA